MRASFVKLQWENHAQTIASFLFQPESRYRYEAGQYAVLHVPHLPMDSRGDERTLTLTSSPDEPLLKFTMRLHGQTGSSFKQALQALQPGARVTIYEALGDLVLPLDTSIPLVFVAGGLGIASFVGMTKWLVDHHESRDIQLHYAVKKADDIIMQPAFDGYHAAGNLTKSLYTPAVNSTYAFKDFAGQVLQRRLTASEIMPGVRPESLIYISGPEAMVNQLINELQFAGITRQHLVFDYFD